VGVTFCGCHTVRPADGVTGDGDADGGAVADETGKRGGNQRRSSAGLINRGKFCGLCRDGILPDSSIHAGDTACVGGHIDNFRHGDYAADGDNAGPRIKAKNVKLRYRCA